MAARGALGRAPRAKYGDEREEDLLTVCEGLGHFDPEQGVYVLEHDTYVCLQVRARGILRSGGAARSARHRTPRHPRAHVGKLYGGRQRGVRGLCERFCALWAVIIVAI